MFSIFGKDDRLEEQQGRGRNREEEIEIGEVK
jgi:hypothetical protein